jgi:hypothetical protein
MCTSQNQHHHLTKTRRDLSSFAFQILGSLPGRVERYTTNQSEVIHGRFPVLGTHAEVWIDCSCLWTRTPPSIYCFEPWIRNDIDWHVYPWHEFCWVHDEEWNKFHQMFQPTVQTSAWYLLNNLAHILRCHRLGFVHDLDCWQKEWGQYAHGDRSKPQLRKTYAEFRRRKSVA